MTPRERELYDLICTYWNDNGYSPSIEELKEGLGVSGNRHVHAMLTSLRDQELIDWNPQMKRTIRPLA